TEGGAAAPARSQSCARRRARAPRSAPRARRHRRRHGHGAGAEGPDPARDRSVAREVLLGLALDAPGHPVLREVHRRRMSASASNGVEGPTTRRTYLDVLRGVALLILI